MSKTLHKELYSGTGNTFVLVDNRTRFIQDGAGEAKVLCHQHKVDGLLLMEKPTEKADIRMRIFNPDGSEAEMCGNGSRCAAHWAHTKAGLPAKMLIQTGAGVLQAEVKGNIAKIRLTEPHDFGRPGKTELNGKQLEMLFINTGVPHVAVPVESVEGIDVNKEGRRIRHDDRFQPKGTNVSFFQKVKPNEIRAYTYERGVEAQTQSCGTGSAACALIASVIHGFTSPVKVQTASGDTLNIYFKRNGESFSDVYLEGPVKVLKP